MLTILTPGWIKELTQKMSEPSSLLQWNLKWDKLIQWYNFTRREQHLFYKGEMHYLAVHICHIFTIILMRSIFCFLTLILCCYPPELPCTTLSLIWGVLTFFWGKKAKTSRTVVFPLQLYVENGIHRRMGRVFYSYVIVQPPTGYISKIKNQLKIHIQICNKFACSFWKNTSKIHK